MEMIFVKREVEGMVRLVRACRLADSGLSVKSRGNVSHITHRKGRKLESQLRHESVLRLKRILLVGG